MISLTPQPHAGYRTDPEEGAEARVAALAEYEILDTVAEAAFDDIVFLAQQACATALALVSFLERDRQWFKARVGTSLRQTPIGQAVCAHALRQTDLLIIPDLAQDPRTWGNPLVQDSPFLRFYAGAPLVTPAGVVIGTVCVLDTVPRPQGLTPVQSRTLETLARQVVAQLELRRLLRREQREAMSLRESDERARHAQEAGRTGLFELDVQSGTLTVSAEFCRLYGLPVSPTYPASAIEALVVREDADLCSNPRTRADGSAALEVDYRIRRPDDGRLCWVARRGAFVRDEAGQVLRMFGTVHDVTERRRLQDHQAALLELGDRLREAGSAAEVTRIASEVLGRTLNVARAGHARIDTRAGRFTVQWDWARPDTAGLAGGYALGAFPQVLARLRRGEAIVVPDVTAAPGHDAAAFTTMGTQAHMLVPLLEKGELVGALYVHEPKPRLWARDEIDFLHGVADRTYAALAKVQAEAVQQVLNQELGHRLKNTLAMVLAIATQTLRSVPEQAPVQAFAQRVRSLAAAHDVLVQQSWSAARIRAVMDSVLGMFGQPERFELTGPDLPLNPRAVLALSLLLHELTTNALKHGALSVAGGRVALAWRVERASGGGAETLVLDWRESGGPPVRPPATGGFGSRLIRMGLAGTGGVDLRYDPAGFSAEMRAPLPLLQVP